MLPVLLLLLSSALRVPEVVWSGAPAPQFVTEAGIDHLAPDVRAGIEQQLAARKKQREEFAAAARANGLVPPLCGPGIIGDTGSSQAPERALAAVPNVAAGTIVDLAAGWDAQRQMVATLALVRITEPWKGSGLAAGDLVTVQLPFGTLHRGADMWCSEQPESERITTGAQLLLAGSADRGPSPRRFLGAGWPIAAGVLYAPRSSPLPLDVARQSAHQPSVH